jgi:capsule polysaccharide export protein KpsE/RkpR
MTDDHAHVNGSEPDASDSEETQIYMPPAELMVQQLHQKLAQQSIELFQLQSAAEFQSGIIKHLQTELQRVSTELSKLKGEDVDDAVEALSDQ